MPSVRMTSVAAATNAAPTCGSGSTFLRPPVLTVSAWSGRGIVGGDVVGKGLLDLFRSQAVVGQFVTVGATMPGLVFICPLLHGLSRRIAERQAELVVALGDGLDGVGLQVRE